MDSASAPIFAMKESTSRLLKQDLLGRVSLIDESTRPFVRRDSAYAHPVLRTLARHLMHRERRALQHLATQGLAEPQGIPQLIRYQGSILERTWIEGRPMHEAKPRDPRYFRAALKLLRQLHAAGISHNDLAKEPNWLVTPQGDAAIVDFQLARRSQRRSALFRLLAYDDLRHLYKHKRSYCPEHLSARQRRLLAQPSGLSKAWRILVKRPYWIITRKWLGWADREGLYERESTTAPKRNAAPQHSPIEPPKRHR